MLINLVVGMISARYLGPSNYGLINYASSIISFVSPIMQLGLSNIMVYELIHNPEKEGEILGTSILMNCASAILCILGVTSFTMMVNAGERDTIIVCMLSSIVLFLQAIEIVIYWFQAKLLSKYTSVLMFCAYAVIAAYKIYLLITGKSIYWYALSTTIQQTLIAAGCLYFYKRLGGKTFSVSFSRAKALFSRSRYYVISSLMSTIAMQTDRVMIKNMLGSAETGYYSCAATCVGMTNFIFAAIIDSMRPTIFENKNKSQKSYEESISLLYCVIIYLSFAQSIAMTLLAKPIVSILYGKAYLAAIPALQILVWHTTFAYLGSVRNIWILAENKQKYLWSINLFAAVSNVILNYLLIPSWGISGASFASMLTQIFTNVVLGFIIAPLRRNNYIMLAGLNVKKCIRWARQ